MEASGSRTAKRVSQPPQPDDDCGRNYEQDGQAEDKNTYTYRVKITSDYNAARRICTNFAELVLLYPNFNIVYRMTMRFKVKSE